MKVRLKAEETLVKKSYATHHFGKEKDGGRLYLTNQRLYFVPHNVNNKRRPIEILLKEIDEVDFVKAHGIISSGVIIISKSGDINEFHLYSRKKWAKEIEDLIAHSD